MKTLALVLFSVLVLSACNSSGGGAPAPTPTSTQSVVDAAPVAPALVPVADPTPTASPDPQPSAQPSVTPPADPSPSPSPVAPSPSPVPTATPVQTQSYGNYSCSLLSDNSVVCDNQPITGFTRSAPESFLSIYVGNGIGCVFEDPNGAMPTTCNPTSTSCANPTVAADVQCWTQTNPTPVRLSGYTQFGFNWLVYDVGPLNMDVGVNPGGPGQVCVIYAAYDRASGTWFSNYTACGMTVTAQGVLQ